jgi:hypothetical protein
MKQLTWNLIDWLKACVYTFVFAVVFVIAVGALVGAHRALLLLLH